MSDYYHLTHIMEYYTCMVDLVTHVGCLDEENDFINNMIIKYYIAMWTCLLSADRIQVEDLHIVWQNVTKRYHLMNYNNYKIFLDWAS